MHGLKRLNSLSSLYKPYFLICLVAYLSSSELCECQVPHSKLVSATACFHEDAEAALLFLFILLPISTWFV